MRAVFETWAENMFRKCVWRYFFTNLWLLYGHPYQQLLIINININIIYQYINIIIIIIIIITITLYQFHLIILIIISIIIVLLVVYKMTYNILLYIVYNNHE